LKILTVSNLYPPHEIGGYEVRTRDVVDELRARGHQIEVLTSDYHVTGRQEIQEPHVSRKLRIHGMYGRPWLPIQQLYGLEKYNQSVFRKALDSFQPDLIHLSNMGGISKSLLHTAEASGIPVVYDLSDHWIARSIRADVWLQWWNFPPSAAAKIARNFLQALGIRKLIERKIPTASWEDIQFRRIYFCSAYMRDHTASKGWPVSHAGVIHCGIDTGAFATKSDYQRFEKLLWVGRISDDKDPFTAVRALAIAHERGLTHLTLDIYGGGTPEDIVRVDAEIQKQGLAEHIRRCTVPASEMRSLYAKYDALLFTSNWGEPFALTPLEASASGLPLISSLDGGQAELVRDGENSLAATAAHPASYADAIARLAANPTLREKIATAAQQEARHRCDISVITGQVEDYFKASLKA